MIRRILPLRILLACAALGVLSSSTAAAESPPIVPAEAIARHLAPSTALAPGRKKKIGFEPAGEAVASAARAAAGRIALPAIEFEFDSDRLTPRAREQVVQLALVLALEPLHRLVFAVQGHTDSVGKRAYNRSLSMRRASAVTGAI